VKSRRGDGESGRNRKTEPKERGEEQGRRSKVGRKGLLREFRFGGASWIRWNSRTAGHPE
jgi:hypothetical protein